MDTLMKLELLPYQRTDIVCTGKLLQKREQLEQFSVCRVLKPR